MKHNRASPEQEEGAVGWSMRLKTSVALSNRQRYSASQSYRWQSTLDNHKYAQVDTEGRKAKVWYRVKEVVHERGALFSLVYSAIPTRKKQCTQSERKILVQ